MREGEHIETKVKVAIKILDKEKIMLQDLGESIKKEISFQYIFLKSSYLNFIRNATIDD